jgi:hypothetical protein
MLHIEAWFGDNVAVGLERSDGETRTHFSCGITDVDLTAGNVVGAAVEGDASGEAGDGVLG